MMSCQESRHCGNVPLPFVGRATDKGRIRIRIRDDACPKVGRVPHSRPTFSR